MIKLLTPADRVVVNDASGTDAPGGGWAVPMQYVVNKAAIDRAIDTMNPVDPMSYKPALTAAYNALQQTNARIKHIIVLGDGDAEDSHSAHVTQIHKAGITISTVATEGGTMASARTTPRCRTSRAGRRALLPGGSHAVLPHGRPAWMSSWQGPGHG